MNLLGYSQNHIYMEGVNSEGRSLRLIGFYKYPEKTRRLASWNLLKQLHAASTLPWCSVGDFKNIANNEDKKGRIPYPLVNMGFL